MHFEPLPTDLKVQSIETPGPCYLTGAHAIRIELEYVDQKFRNSEL